MPDYLPGLRQPAGRHWFAGRKARACAALAAATVGRRNCHSCARCHPARSPVPGNTRPRPGAISLAGRENLDNLIFVINCNLQRLDGPVRGNGKIIARRAKVSATVSMLLCALLMLVMLDHGWPIYLAIAGMSLGNLWIWSRPERLVAPV